MKVKRISIILVATVFLLVTVGCLIGLFSVKKVQVNYAVSENADSSEIQSVLNGFLGDSLLFVKADKVGAAIDDFYYLEVVSVEKDFPNVLKVNLRERKEIYYIKNGSGYAVTTKDGFVLRQATETEVLSDTSRDKILLELDGVNVQSATAGEYIKTDSDALMATVFNMAKSVDLTDCIKTISVFKPNVPGSNVTFETYTGVSIEVAKVENKGVEMAVAAFEAYDNADSDYVKMFSTIKVNLVDNLPKVVWTSLT